MNRKPYKYIEACNKLIERENQLSKEITKVTEELISIRQRLQELQEAGVFTICIDDGYCQWKYTIALDGSYSIDNIVKSIGGKVLDKVLIV
jgi:hypothetical protein